MPQNNYNIPNRASSVDQVEVLADLQTIDDYSRPQSSLEPGSHKARKKKKKKVRKHRSGLVEEEPYANLHHSQQRIHLDNMDTSTVGGMAETESQMFI